MHTSVDCIPCFVRQTSEVAAMCAPEPEVQERIVRRMLLTLANANWSQSPPILAQELHRIIREETGNADPYASVKERMNRLAQEMLPRCGEMMAASGSSRELLVRLVVAGNLLDSAAKTRVESEELPELLDTVSKRPFSGDVAELFRLASEARKILYLADNAGEIVFDRLLVEALSPEKVTLAVRGRPILNDALVADALFAGIPARVIDNGSDAPGTVLDDCSEAFQKAFREADLIISKGQGNYETLCTEEAPIFFLFTVKCPIVSKQVGEAIGTLMAHRSPVFKVLSS